jgi:hypothetical protein
MSTDQWMDYAEQMRSECDRLAADHQRMMLSILAEFDDEHPPPAGTTGSHTIFGKPVRLHVEWLDGLPNWFANADAVREWARAELAKQEQS